MMEPVAGFLCRWW